MPHKKNRVSTHGASPIRATVWKTLLTTLYSGQPMLTPAKKFYRMVATLHTVKPRRNPTRRGLLMSTPIGGKISAFFGLVANVVTHPVQLLPHIPPIFFRNFNSGIL
jgi:hypothetical protein